MDYYPGYVPVHIQFEMYTIRDDIKFAGIWSISLLPCLPGFMHAIRQTYVHHTTLQQENIICNIDAIEVAQYGGMQPLLEIKQ